MENYVKEENFYEKVESKKRHPARGDIVIPYDTASGKLSDMLGVIVITNDCDIINGNAKYLIFLPIYKAKKYFSNSLNKEERKKWYRIITLNHKNLFFLPPHSEIDDDFGGVINFQDIRTQDIEYFNELNPEPKIKLKSPYIDRLCLKVAYLFNRVPINHPNNEEIQKWLEDKV